jgi:hypothetical protein
MQVTKTTIESLFTQDRCYVIPLFQRSYVWGKANQWEPLWEDIAAQADELLQGAAMASRQGAPHFLGAIVLQSHLVYGDRLPTFDVIDGQQRLTTLQLLLFALRDVASASGEMMTAKWAKSKTENQFFHNREDQHKIWPTKRDQAQFREVWEAGSKVTLEQKHPSHKGKTELDRPRMVAAYCYFYEAIDSWAKGTGDVLAALNALRRAVQQRLELVQIDLEPKENTQEIFQTLNSGGVALLASDLLRNYMYSKAKDTLDPEKIDEIYWSRFDVPDDPLKPEGRRFWETTIQQGRFSRARLDLFVQHYLAMKLERDVRVNELFREYQEWYEDKKPFENMEAALEDFTRYADHFKKLLDPDTSTPLGIFATRLEAMDISTAYPLVIDLLGMSALPEIERLGIFSDIESFLIRRAVCDRPTNNYTRKFVELAKDFRSGGTLTRAAFRVLLGRDPNDGFDWPSDVAFEKAWNRIDAYKALKPLRVEMILRAIEIKTRSALGEPVLAASRLTVEHVMPQKWKKHWPLPAGEDTEDATGKRDDVIHDFGNLTLMTGKLNTTLSNGPAAKKLPAVTAHSYLALAKWFTNRTTWSEADIAERGAALYKEAVAIWPRG